MKRVNKHLNVWAGVTLPRCPSPETPGCSGPSRTAGWPELPVPPPAKQPIRRDNQEVKTVQFIGTSSKSRWKPQTNQKEKKIWLDSNSSLFQTDDGHEGLFWAVNHAKLLQWEYIHFKVWMNFQSDRLLTELKSQCEPHCAAIF